jgi:hypothetical protein
VPQSPAASEGRAALPRDGGSTYLLSSRQSNQKRPASSHPNLSGTSSYSQTGSRRTDVSFGLPPCRPGSAGKAAPSATLRRNSPQSHDRLMSATAPARSFAAVGGHRNFSHSALNRSGRAVVAL